MLGRWMSEKKKVGVCGGPGQRERVVFEDEILFLFCFFFCLQITKHLGAPSPFLILFFMCCFACISLWRLLVWGRVGGVG